MNESPLTALDFNPSDVRLGKSYLLLGTDTYLADRVLDTVRLTLKKQENVDTFIIYGDVVKSSDLSEQLDTFSIFSAAKLIIIRNAEKLDKKELEILGDYFDAPSEIQSLVIIGEKIDARLSAWKKAKSGSTTIACDPPRYSGAIRAWMDKALKNMHKTMTSKAIEEFLNRIELDYYSASNELTKLDLLTRDAPVITDKDVLKSLGTTRTGALIDFYRALGRKQNKQALEALDKMIFAEWETLQIFFHFNKLFFCLWRIALLRKAHISDAEIISKHLNDVYLNQRKDFMEFAKNYSLASFPQIFAILLETDAQFKLSVAEPQILLSTCLLKLLAS